MDRFLLLTKISTSTVRILPWTGAYTTGASLVPRLVLECQQELGAEVYPSIHAETQDGPWHCRQEFSPWWRCHLCPAAVFPAVLWEYPGSVTTSTKKIVSKQLWSTSSASPGFGTRKSMLQTNCVQLFISALKAEEISMWWWPCHCAWEAAQQSHAQAYPGVEGSLFLAVYGSMKWFFWKIPPL